MCTPIRACTCAITHQQSHEQQINASYDKLLAQWVDALSPAHSSCSSSALLTSFVVFSSKNFRFSCASWSSYTAAATFHIVFQQKFITSLCVLLRYLVLFVFTFLVFSFLVHFHFSGCTYNSFYFCFGAEVVAFKNFFCL